MEKFKGRLMYMGWFNTPWKLINKDGEIDLWPLVEKFFISLNGKSAEQEWTRDHYLLKESSNSAFQFKYIPKEYVVLEKLEGCGMMNVHAYLDKAMIMLSGRMVEIEIEDGKKIKITADESEKVYGVYLTNGNKSFCDIPDGVEKTVCGFKTPDCCIFLSVGNTGFCCEKFNGPIARTLLDRLARGNIRASHIGNCAILGEKYKYSS